MTDNEIIKALECLHKRILQSKCAEEITETEIMGLVNAHNLINRKDAEIKRLTNSLSTFKSCYESLTDMYENAKSEAIKEFAEMLKHFIIPQKADGYTREIVLKRDIDNLVKEMTKEEKALHKINHNSLCETETYNMGGITNE